MRQKQTPFSLKKPLVVGVIHTAAGFSAARRARVDVVEVRADALPHPPAPEELATLPHPVILTVRSPDEGGARPISDAERLALFLELLPAAAAVDIEGRSLRSLAPLSEAAHRAGKHVIVSYHDFQGTPSPARLRAWETTARQRGADIVKIATTTEHPAAVARLLTLLENASGPLALMGMGPLGRASRLLFARAGSVLNYGWLAAPQVSGQWSATELRALLARV